MIFKQVNELKTIDTGYQCMADSFSFDDIADLIYPDNKNDFLNLQNKIDNRIYPDLIASIYRKMYENGLSRRGSFRDAILACSYHLQARNFKFLGFIRKDEEVNKNSTKIDFITKWDFQIQQYEIKTPDKDGLSIESIEALFDRNDFSEAYNVFFIAGSQSFEMLDLRIKKTAYSITEMITKGLIQTNNIKIILSGWNNAKVPNSKVQFANESLAMRNLLIHKLTKYRELQFSEDFLTHQIDSDINSKDTNENIVELMKKMDEIFFHTISTSKKQLNLFIISSSFHLLQLSDSIKSKEAELKAKLKVHPLKLNVFLIGSENPDHFFRIYDGHYIKLLINEVIHRSFKFCR